MLTNYLKEKNMKNRLLISIVVSVIAVTGIGTVYAVTHQTKPAVAVVAAPVVKSDTVTYHGVAGKTALELLQTNTKAITSGTGTMAFVTSINGRSADTTKKEFWSFYINGVSSTVGAGSYVTKDTDTILWKIETY